MLLPEVFTTFIHHAANRRLISERFQDRDGIPNSVAEFIADEKNRHKLYSRYFRGKIQPTGALRQLSNNDVSYANQWNWQ
jgi:hypothetical protein